MSTSKEQEARIDGDMTQEEAEALRRRVAAVIEAYRPYLEALADDHDK